MGNSDWWCLCCSFMSNLYKLVMNIYGTLFAHRIRERHLDGNCKFEHPRVLKSVSEDKFRLFTQRLVYGEEPEEPELLKKVTFLLGNEKKIQKMESSREAAVRAGRSMCNDLNPYREISTKEFAALLDYYEKMDRFKRAKKFIADLPKKRKKLARDRDMLKRKERKNSHHVPYIGSIDSCKTTKNERRALSISAQRDAYNKRVKKLMKEIDHVAECAKGDRKDFFRDLYESGDSVLYKLKKHTRKTGNKTARELRRKLYLQWDDATIDDLAKYVLAISKNARLSLRKKSS